MRRVLVWASVFVGAGAFVAGEAFPEEGVYPHPLLVGDLDLPVPKGLDDAAARALLHDLIVYDEGFHDESGEFITRSVVRVAERHAAVLEAGVAPVPAAELPVIDQPTSWFLGDAGPGEERTDVQTAFGPIGYDAFPTL